MTMNISSASLEFVLFGLAAAITSNFSLSPRWRSGVLAFYSLVFILMVTHQGIQLLPLAGFLILGYCALLFVQSGGARYMAWMVVTIVLAYIWLKKYSFLPGFTFIRYPYLTLGLLTYFSAYCTW